MTDVERWRREVSFPFFTIAKDYGIPYAVVLAIDEKMGTVGAAPETWKLLPKHIILLIADRHVYERERRNAAQAAP